MLWRKANGLDLPVDVPPPKPYVPTGRRGTPIPQSSFDHINAHLERCWADHRKRDDEWWEEYLEMCRRLESA